MNERRVEQKVFKVFLDCPKCAVGTMVSTGMGRSNSVGSWVLHRCNKCQHEQDVPTPSYPRIEYEEVFVPDYRDD